MLASELEAKLKELREKHGDLPVAIFDTPVGLDEIGFVTVHPKSGLKGRSGKGVIEII
jgi:hypothetical protein